MEAAVDLPPLVNKELEQGSGPSHPSWGCPRLGSAHMAALAPGETPGT